MNKRTFFLLLPLVIPTIVDAYDARIDGIYYNFSEDQASVVYAGGTEAYWDKVTIPDVVTYNGKNYSVTSICDSAFYHCLRLPSVAIPNSVTSIGDYAFAGCRSLPYVNIPNSVTSIGDYAFSGCYSLSSITIPSSLAKIGMNAFHETSWFNNQADGLVYAGNVAYSYKGTMLDREEVVIKDGTLGIAGAAFRFCRGLISVSIPNSVTVIGNEAFLGCNLTSVTLPNGVSFIGRAAFYNCNLTSVTIPDSLTSIGYAAFKGCGLTSITIPNSVTSIGKNSFSYNRLTSIIIPESVTTIESSAFSYCDSLYSIKVCEGNSTYDSRNGCNAIIETATNTLIVGCTKTVIPESVTSIGEEAFFACTGMTSIVIPRSVTSIGDNAFSGCTGLTSIAIPEGVTSIGNSAFSGCKGLLSVNVPSNVTSIGDGAFYGCSSLMAIIIPNNVEKIEDNTFRYCKSLSSVTIGKSVKSIGRYAFSNCSGLVAITIPNSVTTIGPQAFNNCTSLTSATIPNSIKTIGSQAFYQCTSLTSITIPNSMTSIESLTFQDCSSLTSVTIPNSVTSISSAFWGCSSLTSVDIPNSVISIGGGAFSRTGLTSVVIPESVTSMNYNAFSQCGNLNTVTLNSNSIVSESRQAKTSMNRIFGDQVHNYILGEEVTNIGNYAFYACDSLESITIGDRVTSIGDNAFPPTITIFAPVGKTLFTLWTSGYKNIKEVGSRRELAAPELLLDASTSSSLKMSFTNEYSEMDETVTIQGEQIEKGDNGYEIVLRGLEPDMLYNEIASYSLTYDDVFYTRSYSFCTQPLTLATQQPKVISEGNIIVAAETNLDDEETNVGFEWRRIDWTDDFDSKTGGANIYEGMMQGYIRSLNSNYLWKYRPFYTTNSGKTYYGDWKGIDPTDYSYFEPTVHTYATIIVTGNNARVKGYAMRGTDNVSSQGFMYWSTGAASSRRMANGVPADAKTVLASGNVMTATLENLEYETEYCCVAFVSTSEGETFYGEIQSFKTKIDPDGLEDMIASEELVEVDRYDLQGRKLTAPQNGINIIRYSDGTSGKVLVK